jgi:eukaryotic-like serine/threonine-protein kinase
MQLSQTGEQFGKYYLLEKLNQGGMAEVYLSRHIGAEGIGKFVAIKRILPQFSENTDFVEMFKEEAKIAVNLAHSNVVSIHEFGIEKSQFFLVMDYVEGRDLRRILNKMKKSGLSLSIEQVLYIIKEVAAGLDSAHRCLDRSTGKPLNINHRDISPQNVMISFEGEVKIVDFGIAKAETQLETTRAGTLKGKFGYMSPEQAEGQVVDLRTDIFSLGIVLWELLANDRLFVANNEVNTLRKIRECQIPSLRKINPNIPVDLEKIVNKALARDRNLRYQTSAALHRDLSRFLNRQYPDFSPHDFSVFIKTLFAAEILEHRKKIVEYSKFDPSRPRDATPLQVQIQVSIPEAAPKGNVTPEQSVFTNPTQIDTENSISHSSAYFLNNEYSQAEKEKNPKGNPTKVEIPTERPPSTSQIFSPTPAKKETVRINDPMKKTPNEYAELRFDRGQRPQGQTTGVREGSYNTRTGNYPSGLQMRERNRVMEIVQQSLIATAVLFCVAAFGFYANSPQKAKGVALNFLEKAGVLKQQRDIASNGASEQPSSAVMVKVAITSQPPTAELWIDGKLEGDVTPTTAEFEAGREYSIMIQKAGFVPYQAKRTFKRGEKVAIILQRAKTAYVDIIVEGSGEIYVNDKRVAVAGPVLSYQIPADEDVVIRAVDPRTQASDEQRVRIGENFSKQVKLYPKARLPGSTTNK